jgi:hypothetical protein
VRKDLAPHKREQLWRGGYRVENMLPERFSSFGSSCVVLRISRDPITGIACYLLVEPGSIGLQLTPSFP